jgi:hypothetical protein
LGDFLERETPFCGNPKAAANFLRRLARGKHSISYRLRAKIPSTLPTKVYAMYAPELKANSDEIKLKFVDRPPLGTVLKPPKVPAP